jgi:hypothetical protein
MKNGFVQKLALVVALVIHLCAHAQQDSAVETKSFKNTIYYNISNPMIFGYGSVIFGWERQLKNDRSFSINIGKPSYPGRLLSGRDSTFVNSKYKESGLHVSGEYRKYLTSLNRHKAPRGVFIGAYGSTNNFKRKLEWELSTTSFNGTVVTELGINIHSAGIEFGYQFVFWNRVSLDFVLMGPGIAFYQFEATIGTDLSEEDEDELNNIINDYLSENFPGYDRLFDAGEFSRTGSTGTMSMGFRYVVTVGFRF